MKEYSGDLVRTRCWCGIQLAIPEILYKEMERRAPGARQNCHCPLGHTFIFTGKGKESILLETIERERRMHADTKAKLHSKEMQRRGEMGAKTRLSKRLEAMKETNK